MINEQAIEEIRNRVDLRSLAEEAGVIFHGSSGNCPLHAGSDNPTAFHVYEGGKRWHCFTRCPEGKNDGDVIAFYMQWKGVEFRRAVEDLALRVGVSLDGNSSGKTGKPEPKSLKPMAAPVPQPPGEAWQKRAEEFVMYAQGQLSKSSKVRAYLTNERGLNPCTWEAFRLGYNPNDIFDAPENWGLDGKKIWLPRGVVIPGEAFGQHWYVKIRRPMGEEDSLAEYIGPSKEMNDVKFGGPRGGVGTLFGADLWLDFPILMLVEGEWDAMIAWKNAFDFCNLGSLGSATSRADLMDYAALARYAGVIAIYDDDAAGEKARKYWNEVRLVMGNRLSVVKPPDHDLTDYWLHNGNLRRWLADLVAGKMETILGGMDRQRFAEKYQDWEKIYDYVNGCR